ncbi:MAG: DUF4838 domain-containing protein [Lentisphaerae bacterium]|nr:DUF4838 domain-containing protein [Lentisphaerota bacterium]
MTPAVADRFEQQAAALLQRELRRATGVTDGFAIVAEKDADEAAGGFVLAIGRTRWGDAKRLETLWQDGFIIRRTNDTLIIAGGKPRGTLFGAVRFLDRYCGVRFYLPDPLFTSCPESPHGLPTVIDVVEEPFVRATSMSGSLPVPGYSDRWLVPIAGDTRTGLAGTHQHNMGQAFPPARHASVRPEIYPLVKDARYIPSDAADQKWNPCFSEPKLLDAAEEYAVEYYRAHPDHLWCSLAIQDSSVMCECPRCLAFIAPHVRRDAVLGRVAGYSEMYWRFMNTLAARLETNLPGRRIEGLAYAMTRVPPPFKLHRNIVVFANLHIAELDADGILTAGDDGVSRLDRWLDVAAEFGNHDWHQGNGYLIPRIYSGYWSRFLRHLKGRVAFTYQHAETYPNFGLDGAKAYVLAQMWWNPDVDPAAVWRQFCADMFGPAASPMFDYFAMLEALWTSLDNVEGPERKLSRWSTQFVTSEKDRATLRRCRELLDEAAALARAGNEKKRVELFSKTFRMSEYLFEFAAAPSISAARIEEAKRHAREAILPDPLTLYPAMRSQAVIDAAIAAAVGTKSVR